MKNLFFVFTFLFSLSVFAGSETISFGFSDFGASPNGQRAYTSVKSITWPGTRTFLEFSYTGGTVDTSGIGVLIRSSSGTDDGRYWIARGGFTRIWSDTGGIVGVQGLQVMMDWYQNHPEFSGLFPIVVTYKWCPDTSECSAVTCPTCNVSYCSAHDTHVCQCPNQPACVKVTCPLCQQVYCSTHTTHTCPQCPNKPTCNKVTCSKCGVQYCSVHGTHTCNGGQQGGGGGDDPVCPNMPTCVNATCPKCNATYCSVHGSHACPDCPNRPGCVNTTCPICTVQYCSTHATHTCAACPNKPNCVSVTCPTCQQTYCSTHATHTCPLCPNLPTCNTVACSKCGVQYCSVHGSHTTCCTAACVPQTCSYNCAGYCPVHSPHQALTCAACQQAGLSTAVYCPLKGHSCEGPSPEPGSSGGTGSTGTGENGAATLGDILKAIREVKTAVDIGDKTLEDILKEIREKENRDNEIIDILKVIKEDQKSIKDGLSRPAYYQANMGSSFTSANVPGFETHSEETGTLSNESFSLGSQIKGELESFSPGASGWIVTLPLTSTGFFQQDVSINVGEYMADFILPLRKMFQCIVYIFALFWWFDIIKGVFI